MPIEERIVIASFNRRQCHGIPQKLGRGTFVENERLKSKVHLLCPSKPLGAFGSITKIVKTNKNIRCRIEKYFISSQTKKLKV